MFLLQLGLWQEALEDAEKARNLAKAALKSSKRSAPPGYVKTFLRKGTALSGQLPATLSLQRSALQHLLLTDPQGAFMSRPGALSRGCSGA